MGHEWKIGDWAEANGNRYFVYRVVGGSVFGVMESGTPSWDIACTAKHLPECTGWEWEPSKPVEPTARKWEFGDWAHSPEGIVRFFFEKDGGGLCVSKDGRSHCFQFKYLEYLPDCTGFDWNDPVWNPINPIEPPLGYRIIADGVVSDGDMSLQDRGWYYSTAKGRDIAELLDLGAAKAYARKIEQPKAVPPAGYRLLGRDEVVADGDLLIKRAPAGNDCKWIAATGDCFDVTVGYLVDIYHIACFARKIEPKPIDPPKGYRLMSDDETIVLGDMFWQGGVWNETGIFFSKITVKEAKGKYTRYCAAYARKIEPRYRPFANAAEFSPHRDKWLVDYDGDLVRVIALADEKLATSYGRISFEDAFVRYKFEDGNPFGVLETEPEHAGS